MILFEEEFFKLLSNIYKFYARAVRKKSFDDEIKIVDYKKICYKLKVFNDEKVPNSFDMRLIKGHDHIFICHCYKDVSKLLLKIRQIFMAAITSNSKHIKSCENLILKLSEFLSSKEELIKIFEGFKKWENLSGGQDNPAMQYYKIFLRSSSNAIIQYIILIFFADSGNTNLLHFDHHKNTNSPKKLGWWLTFFKHFVLK